MRSTATPRTTESLQQLMMAMYPNKKSLEIVTHVPEEESMVRTCILPLFLTCPSGHLQIVIVLQVITALIHSPDPLSKNLSKNSDRAEHFEILFSHDRLL